MSEYGGVMMLNLISGVLLLCGVLGLAWRYRPKERDSLLICGIGLFMGFLSLLMSDGWLPLQAVEQGMQALVLGMCFCQLRRESRERKARAAMTRKAARKLVPAQRPAAEKFRPCA